MARYYVARVNSGFQIHRRIQFFPECILCGQLLKTREQVSLAHPVRPAILVNEHGVNEEYLRCCEVAHYFPASSRRSLSYRRMKFAVIFAIFCSASETFSIALNERVLRSESTRISTRSPATIPSPRADSLGIVTASEFPITITFCDISNLILLL